jgi:hypothetical protein
MYPQLKPLKQKKLHQQIKKQEVKEKRIRLYLMNQNWLKIRKQKDRRRRRVLERLWRMRQEYLMRIGELPMPTLQ